MLLSTNFSHHKTNREELIEVFRAFAWFPHTQTDTSEENGAHGTKAFRTRKCLLELVNMEAYLQQSVEDSKKLRETRKECQITFFKVEGTS